MWNIPCCTIVSLVRIPKWLAENPSEQSQSAFVFFGRDSLHFSRKKTQKTSQRLHISCLQERCSKHPQDTWTFLFVNCGYYEISCVLCPQGKIQTACEKMFPALCKCFASILCHQCNQCSFPGVFGQIFPHHYRNLCLLTISKELHATCTLQFCRFGFDTHLIK